MGTVRKYWRCTNSQCKDDRGRHRGYKKVHLGQKSEECKHCHKAMTLSENYTTRIMKDGKTVTKSVSPRKGDADAHLAACVVSRKSGALFPGEETLIFWKKAVERFEEWIDSEVEKGELSRKTAKYYRDGLKPLSAWFSLMPLQQIEKEHLEAFINDRRKHVSASMTNCSIATLKRLYTILCDGVKARNFPRLHEAKTDIFKVKLCELNNANQIFLETDEEIEALLSECRTPHLHHFVFGILNTGLRHNDMFTLKQSEISFSRGVITKSVKGKTVVTIPLTPQYRGYLEEWIKNQRVRSINGYITPSPRNPALPIGETSRIGFGDACERVAVQFEKRKRRDLAEKFRHLTPHHLRHTFATHYLYKTSEEYGVTVAVNNLSQILGHSSSYITERYSHVIQELAQGAMHTYGDNVFNNINFAYRGETQGRCSCGAMLSYEGVCSRCKNTGNRNTG